MTFELLGGNIAPLYFKTERVAKTVLRAWWFWATSVRFPGTLEIYSSFGDSKLSADGLGLQWNGHSTFFWTLTFDLLGRNIALLHFKTERVVETASRQWWFWPTAARFPGSCHMFSIPGEAKLTSHGLSFQLNGHSKTFWRLAFELMGRNIAPLNFKTERVAETALRASWFWDTSDRFPANTGIFSSPGDYKVTPDGLALEWNGHSTTFWTLALELLGGNIAPVHFKNERVTRTALRALWFWPTLARFPGKWGIFSGIGDSKLTPDCLGRNVFPVHFKTERVNETAVRL